MKTTNKLTIVAFGDSITAAREQEPSDRWPALLQHDLQRRFPAIASTVVNAGVGGNTTREGLARIDADVVPHRPDYVLVEFGNDLTDDPQRHVDFDEFVNNLELIRAKVMRREGGILVLLTFPPIIDPWHSGYQREFFKKRGGQDVFQERYRQLTRQFAQLHKLPLLDIDKALRTAMAAATPADYILKDGVHLTTRANRLLADIALNYFVEKVISVTA